MIDLEATFLKNEGNWAQNSFSINGGYFYHSVLAHGIYAHLIYPGESYSYNESTGGFDSDTYHKGFLMGSVGLGLS